ncbi:hypothetical protein ABH920_004366 [Catenulispora sp. EB89]|uniref:hypothetical protein n=1 Tax=Catenulispora sp. EB89 TaxID=3156257 RepID=UPI00351891A4
MSDVTQSVDVNVPVSTAYNQGTARRAEHPDPELAPIFLHSGSVWPQRIGYPARARPIPENPSGKASRHTGLQKTDTAHVLNSGLWACGAND